MARHMSDSCADLVIQAAKVQKAFEAQRKYLLVTTKAKKPEIGPDFFEAIKPMQEACGEVNSIKEANRGGAVYNQLATVAESIEVIGWFGAEAKPHKQVEEALGSAQYWGNRVLKEFKEK